MTPPRRGWSVLVGTALLAAVGALALFAPVIAPNNPDEQFQDRAYAPPMRVRVWEAGGPRAPFVHQQVLDDRLRRRYRDETGARVALSWFSGGRLVSIDRSKGPLLLLGGDALGRDVFSRVVHGARLSLGVTVLGVLGALAIGALVGGLAGSSGGATEGALMLLADFVLVLPGAYLVLVLRGVLPAVLSVGEVFALMAALFALAAWPHAARGVRAIVATERARDYAEASRAAGAGRLRLAVGLMPAARGFLAVEVALLVPALLVAEATVSYLGLGFPQPTASWGTLLQEAANVRILSEAPWLLAPAAALFVVVLAVQLVSLDRAPAGILLAGDGSVMGSHLES